MKAILESTFDSYLKAINNEFDLNMKTYGSFSLTFDIWTSNIQIVYLGIIVSYIDSDFKLNYKLISKFKYQMLSSFIY